MFLEFIRKDDIERFHSLISTLFPDSVVNKEQRNNDDQKLSISSVDFFKKLIKKVFSNDKSAEGLTIIVEDYHVDRFFRDCYYMYFSNQHFQIDRYCKRVSVFTSEFSKRDFFKGNQDEQFNTVLNSSFVGSFVIRPISGNAIGRSLINPMYVLPEKSSYIRVSKFEVNICGVRLYVNAFPYQMQDMETMRCSEVTLINLMDYYSNAYNDYKVTLPSDIVSLERKHSHERVLPSRGITYHQLTRILSDLGFAPRLYNVEAMPQAQLSPMNQTDYLKRILHFYVASGIPVAVNVEPKGKGVGHSLICIGHTNEINIKKAFLSKKYIGNSFESELAIINSADFYENYVVVDDNQFPYEIKSFSHLTLYADMLVSNISVPLYKRMFLEAADAYDISMMILEHERWGVFTKAKDYIKNEKNIVVRLFLASSRSYKNHMVESYASCESSLSAYYANLRMPKFVWVCEVYKVNGYLTNERMAFAELILDATSVSKKGIRNLIHINYPKQLFARNPDQPEKDLLEESFLEVDDWKEIIPYNKNLCLF